MHIGLLCQHDCVEEEDLPLVAALQAQGFTTQAFDWKAPLEADAMPELMLVRSSWDYQDDVAAFLRRLEQIDSHCRLFNPLELIRWNIDKTYLADLSAKGVSIVPTRFCPWVDADEVEAARGQFGRTVLVIKKAMGAGAIGQVKLQPHEELTQAQIEALSISASGVLIQPYLQAFAQTGEWSLVYFAGAHVTSVRKLPAAGDYRVQHEYGGSEQVLQAPASLHELAEQVLAALPVAPLYARVDMVAPDDGASMLVEVELIEPRLYFDTAPQAAPILAQALKQYG